MQKCRIYVFLSTGVSPYDSANLREIKTNFLVLLWLVCRALRGRTNSGEALLEARASWMCGFHGGEDPILNDISLAGSTLGSCPEGQLGPA